MGRLEGRLEAVVDGRAIGWAWDPERPEHAVEVEVVVDEEPVAMGRADVERASLAEAGIGDGRHGFDIALPEQLLEAHEHTVGATAGPDREGIPTSHRFETLVRVDRWQGTRFVPQAKARPAFVPEPDAPVDPGRAAMVGRHGWLFAADEANLTPEQLRGAPLLTPAAVERRRDQAADRRRRLRTLRIPYVFAVAPMKERVYSRFLPPAASLDPERPVDQIDRALRAVGAGEILDLLPPLRALRRTDRVFPRTSSTWSDRGAFAAYRELMREIEKRVVDLSDPSPLEEAAFVSRRGFQGDLADKPKVELTEGGFSPAVKTPPTSEEIDVAEVSRLRALRMPAPRHLEVGQERAPRLYEIDDPALPRAVLVGDACCLALIPWLAEHFGRLVFLWTDEPPLETIELEMPDVVIHVISERGLLHPT